MSVSEWFARNLSYPGHEWLRGRPTGLVAQTLAQLARTPRALVQDDLARRLRATLSFAGEKLPYYAELFRRRGVDPQARDPYGELARLPVLEKSTVRARGAEMVFRDVPGGLIRHSSGGTTGDTLHFYIDRIRQAQDLGGRMFVQQWFGVQPGDRRAYLWGSPIEVKRARIKRWRDRLLNEILLDAFELAPPQIEAHLAKIRRFQARLIYGYPSAMALLSQHARGRLGPDEFPALRAIVLTGEEVTADQVALVREVFGCPVVEEYGAREVGLIAHECPYGNRHIIAPHVHVEVLSQGRSVPPGDVGDIICTPLNTRAQPLLRYRIGDVGALVAGDCPCGVPFPLLRLTGGKVTGFIVLSDGRLCHGAVTSHILRDQPGIVEFKTHQRAIDVFEVLLVVDERFRPETLRLVSQRYRRLFGAQVRADCRVVDRIPPDVSGKRRYVVSDVAPQTGAGAIVDRPSAPEGSPLPIEPHGEPAGHR
ncbi:MAG: AMP-binding protein [Planctomycetes bacterium]|nr:AMP-binding protein [Planctomycetota bacterium]